MLRLGFPVLLDLVVLILVVFSFLFHDFSQDVEKGPHEVVNLAGTILLSLAENHCFNDAIAALLELRREVPDL